MDIQLASLRRENITDVHLRIYECVSVISSFFFIFLFNFFYSFIKQKYVTIVTIVHLEKRLQLLLIRHIKTNVIH